MILFHRNVLVVCLLFTVGSNTKSPTFDTIAQAHLASLPVDLELEQKQQEKKKTDLQKAQPWVHIQDSKRDSYTYFYNFFSNSGLPYSDILDESGLHELELVCGNTNKEAHVLSTIPVITPAGTIYTAYLLTNPTNNIEILRSRQAIIKTLYNDSYLAWSCTSLLEMIRDNEASLFALLKKSELNEKLFKSLFYTNNWPVFKKLKNLNTSTGYQRFASINNYFMIAVFNVGTFYMFKHLASNFNNLSRKDKEFALQFFIGGPFMAFSVSLAIKLERIDLEVHLQKSFINLTQVLRLIDTVAQYQTNYPALKSFAHASIITKYTDPEHPALTPSMKKLLTLLRNDTFMGKESYSSNHGYTRVAYALLHECREEINKLFKLIGEIDTYLACVKLLKEHEGKTASYGFADYINNAQTPYIHALNLWHPLIDSRKSVTNSMEIGNQGANVILTGPNAGGKSTFLKALTINVLFAQTLGIVPAKQFVITPFSKINTYMNIADDTAGGNSRFKAEVVRAQKLLTDSKNLPKNKFAFSVMDEMFSGTSPKEGEAASYAVAQKIGSLSNSMLVLATHFQKLTELQDTDGTFKNYQVRVVRYNDGTFGYPFKLEEGKADQNVAIEILQREGFDASILDSAHAILNNQ